jgi:LuxR family maltose regulon positive regulatory protein
LTTVKTHTSLAYQKLNVNNAMDAVLKAQALGLIE